MSRRESWLRAPQQREPEPIGEDYVRRCSMFDLSLLDAQCRATYGATIDEMTSEPTLTQLRILAFTVAFALCDSEGVPLFPSGDQGKPAETFLAAVERIAKTAELAELQPICEKFLEVNVGSLSGSALEDAKKNLSTTPDSDSSGSKPRSAESPAPRG